MARTLALIGLRCSGKSTLGRALAQHLKLPFVDLDDELVCELGPGAPYASAGALLADHGEAVLRAFESRALRRVLESEDQVLATGGGVVERAENRRLLAERARCVWLDADVAVLQARLCADSTLRPSLTGVDAAGELARLAERREPWYRGLADARVDSTDKDPRETLEALLATGVHTRPAS